MKILHRKQQSNVLVFALEMLVAPAKECLYCDQKLEIYSFEDALSVKISIY